MAELTANEQKEPRTDLGGKQPDQRRSAIHYNRILVPVTPSTAGERAVVTAALLASERRTVITLVHVLEVPKELPLNALFPEEEHEGQQLLRHASSILDHYSVHYQTRSMRSPTAAAAILEAAQDTNAQILIIGTGLQARRGRTVFDRNVETILKKASCRVMLVACPHAQDDTPS